MRIVTKTVTSRVRVQAQRGVRPEPPVLRPTVQRQVDASQRARLHALRTNELLRLAIEQGMFDRLNLDG